MWPNSIDPACACCARSGRVLEARRRWSTPTATSPPLILKSWATNASVRPSLRLGRTELTATVTHEYDSTAYTGSFAWQMEPGVALNIAGYDTIETFGHQLRRGLQGLPTDFVNQRDSFGQQFNGCVFSAQPGTGAE